MSTQETTQSSTEQQQSDDAAFADGFHEARGAEPSANTDAPATPAAATEKPATTPATGEPAGTAAPAKGAEQPQAATEVPPWKADIDALAAKVAPIDEIGKAVRQIHSHIGNLATQTKEIRAALDQAKAATEAKGAPAPSAQQVKEASGSTELWKQLCEDYPDWAEAIDQRLAAFKAETATKAAPPVDASEIEKKIAAEVDKRVEKRLEDQRMADICERIDEVHEGWQELIKSDPFKAWEAKQPADIRALAQSPKPKDAIRYIDLYKADLKKAAEKAEQDARLKRAVTPSGVAVTAHAEDAEDAFADGFNSVRAASG